MGGELLAPDQVPLWVPGELTVRGPEVGAGVTVRGYRYGDADVEVPALRDFTVVAHRRGVTDMARRAGAGWLRARVAPGDVSLLTRGVESHWRWDRPIEVVHVYLTGPRLAAVCRELYDREVDDVELHDTIRADDPALHRTVLTIAEDAGGIGGELLVETLTTALCVSLLRRHAHVRLAVPDAPEHLDAHQERLVRDYVQAHLHERLTLADLAVCVGTSTFRFARQFRGSTGTSPHEFVVRRRVERARRLLRRTDTPLGEVAQTCGFADQSHMNRVLKKRLGVTPGAVRRAG